MVEAETPRPRASEAADGALLCHVDQLPPDRCVACGTATQGRFHRVAIQGRATQTHGRAWLAVCPKCAQSPAVPAVLGLVLLASTTGFVVLNGATALLQTVVGYLLAAACFGIANHRRTLRIGELVEADHMFKLQRVAPEILTEVLALGAAPHPRCLPQQRQLP